MSEANNMNYLEARMQAFAGSYIRRDSWDPIRKIRPWRESDADYIGVQNPDVLVEDCPKPADCDIRVYVENKDDINAKDWQIAN